MAAYIVMRFIVKCGAAWVPYMLRRTPYVVCMRYAVSTVRASDYSTSSEFPPSAMPWLWQLWRGCGGYGVDLAGSIVSYIYGGMDSQQCERIA